MKYLILLSVIFLVSCNPCRYVSKHPECFPADSIVIEKNVTHYEKVYITNDSIIRDTVPCDPITKTYYKTNTVYKTKTITKVDTIYTNTTTSKLNPINSELQKEKDKLLNKLKTRNKIMGIMSIILLIVGIVIYIKIKY